MQHAQENDSVPTHVEACSFSAGALEFSPGNGDLLPPIEKALTEIKAGQLAQYQVGDKAQRLAGACALLLVVIDPIARELEIAERAYLASPQGKDKASFFEASAADILGKFGHADRDAALKKIDEAVTKDGLPAGLKDVARRFHAAHERLATVAAAVVRNAEHKDEVAKQVVHAKRASTTASLTLAGQLQARNPNDPDFVDAHFKPAPKRTKKAADKTTETDQAPPTNPPDKQVA